MSHVTTFPSGAVAVWEDANFANDSKVLPDTWSPAKNAPLIRDIEGELKDLLSDGADYHTYAPAGMVEVDEVRMVAETLGYRVRWVDGEGISLELDWRLRE